MKSKSKFCFLAVATSFAAVASNADAGLIGPAGGYNAFILGDYTLTNSSIEGSVAAGGNVRLSNFTVDSTGHGASSALVAGGNITANGGTVNGNVSYGGTASITSATVSGTQSVATPIDFTTARTTYQNYSVYLAALAPTGTVVSQYGGLTLTGTGSALNVFNLSGALLASTNSFNLVVPQGSTALINVDGVTDSLQNFGFNLGTSSQDVLLNFYQATGLSASGIDIRASVLAPLATFTFANGQMEGNLIAANFAGGPSSTGALHDSPFVGTLPSPTGNVSRAVGEPSTLIMLATGLLAFVLMRRRSQPTSERVFAAPLISAAG